MIDNSSTTAVLKGAIADAQELLTSFASGDELSKNFTTAFDSKYHRGVDSFPEIEILASVTINNANGAYSVDTNKI